LKVYEGGKRETATEAANQYTWERYGAETLSHYEQVIAGHTGFSAELVAIAEKPSQMTIAAFMNSITNNVEEGDLKTALSFYDEHRNSFTEQIPELGQVDALLKMLRSKMQKTKT
jgi:TnpA family transposase